MKGRNRHCGEKGAYRLKKTKKQNSGKRAGYNYLAMLGITVIALILLGWMMFQTRTLEHRLGVYDAKASALEQSIEDEEDRTREIKALEKYMTTDEYVEEAAREKLGLVKDNEIVFEEERQSLL